MPELSKLYPLFYSVVLDATDAFLGPPPTNWSDPGRDEYWGIGAAAAWVLLKLPQPRVIALVAERLDDMYDPILDTLSVQRTQQALRNWITAMLDGKATTPNPNQQLAFHQELLATSAVHNRLRELVCDELARNPAINAEDQRRYNAM